MIIIIYVIKDKENRKKVSLMTDSDSMANNVQLKTTTQIR